MSLLCIIFALLVTIDSSAAHQSLTELPDRPNPNSIGVGFDLKDSYGTVAVSHPNGTLVSIARIDATKEYRDTMYQLSLLSSRHYAPPYSNSWEYWSDYPRQRERKARKERGLPASDDVGAISSLIWALKTETETTLGFPILSASASIPRLPAIYDEDLYDSFEYAGLDYLQVITSTSSDGRLFTSGSMAALAGHNLGLCPNVTHPKTCEADGRLEATYYVVDYSKTSLFAYRTDTLRHGVYYVIDPMKFSLELGSNFINDNPSNDYYWDAVRKVLLEPLLNLYWDPPTTIVLVGESAQNADFRQFFHRTLHEFYKDDLPPIYDQDTLFSQAKGVAELMRRWKYLPKPWKPDSYFSTSLQIPVMG